MKRVGEEEEEASLQSLSSHDSEAMILLCSHSACLSMCCLQDTMAAKVEEAYSNSMHCKHSTARCFALRSYATKTARQRRRQIEIGEMLRGLDVEFHRFTSSSEAADLF